MHLHEHCKLKWWDCVIVETIFAANEQLGTGVMTFISHLLKFIILILSEGEEHGGFHGVIRPFPAEDAVDGHSSLSLLQNFHPHPQGGGACWSVRVAWRLHAPKRKQICTYEWQVCYPSYLEHCSGWALLLGYGRTCLRGAEVAVGHVGGNGRGRGRPCQCFRAPCGRLDHHSDHEAMGMGCSLVQKGWCNYNMTTRQQMHPNLSHTRLPPSSFSFDSIALADTSSNKVG